MKTIKELSSGEHFAAVSLGRLDELSDFVYRHPGLGTDVKGKVFTGEALGSTAAEISFQYMEPGQETSFLHQHREHEEIYVFLKGQGQFLIDGQVVDVSEGTLIRVDPSGMRTWRNNGQEALLFMVIQARKDSLSEHNIHDGFRVKGQISYT